jgi:hypothetical protein
MARTVEGNSLTGGSGARVGARFTFDGADQAASPRRSAIWSPDGATIIFELISNGKYGLYRKASNLSGSEELVYAGSWYGWNEKSR